MEGYIEKQIELAKKGADLENLKIEFSTKTGDVFINGIQILENEDFEELKPTNISLLLELYVNQIEFLKKL